MEMNASGGAVEVERREKEWKEANRGGVRWSHLVLRLMALVLTLLAAVLLAVDRQTKVVPIRVISTLPPVHVPITAKSHYLSAFVYFVVVNAVACAYVAFSLVLTLAASGGKRGLTLMITILDLVMVGLIFSGNGAAGAIGVIGYEGNSRVRWNKVCNVFSKFCHLVAIALISSLLGGVMFLWLIILATLNLHTTSRVP
ncbi:hypothetical protein NMG60_11029803 [Bertholletia excelsa]